MDTIEDIESEEPTLFSTKGRYIVDAITGRQTNLRVGSKYERQFWKVTDVSGPLNERLIYFFSSPEVYETTRNVKMSSKMKDSWKKRRDGANCTCLSVHVCAL